MQHAGRGSKVRVEATAEGEEHTDGRHAIKVDKAAAGFAAIRLQPQDLYR